VTDAAGLLDALAIRDLIHSYARGVDRRDLDLVRSCFTSDCSYEGALATGRIADMLAALPAAMARYRSTLHFMGEPAITVDGDRARATTNTVAYHVFPHPAAGMRTVAVRYEDDLRRTPGGWRIASRRVVRLWEAA
jgi:3-phenylpropionate/cinnamic acid dioxygenase small subunit